MYQASEKISKQLIQEVMACEHGMARFNAGTVATRN